MENNNIEYEDRVVAFIDILGFKNIVNNPNNFESIKKVACAIRDEKKDTDRWNKYGDSVKFLETYFSDSMIISARFRGTVFLDLLTQVGFLMQTITACGFVARGGIAIGKLYHKDGVVFGPALIDAYNIESNIAIYPRILMTEETYKQGVAMDDGINDYATRKEFCDSLVREAIINELGEKYYYIDYLNQQDDFDYDDQWLSLLSKAKHIIENAFSTIKDKHVLQKYEWFEMYLKKVLKENKIDYKVLEEHDRAIELLGKYPWYHN